MQPHTAGHSADKQRHLVTWLLKLQIHTLLNVHSKRCFDATFH
jgi:hypothetical protein